MIFHANEHGSALIAMLVMLVLGLTVLLTGSLDLQAMQLERERATFAALAQAKAALVGDAATQQPVAAAGFLRLPDLGFKVGNLPSEGSSAPNFGSNDKDFSVAGKLPWRTLGLAPLRDGTGECLWYVVSGRFKNTPATDALNWDTQGQITLSDGNGNVMASDLAALVIAAGPPLDGQSRSQADPAYAQCRGNYDARNYLDPYDAADAVSGAPNYFGGSTNNRVAQDSGGKLLVMAATAHYNDRFLPITTGDIFRAVMRRADFAAHISALMDDAYFRSAPVSGGKGTGSVNCSLLAPGNQAFCKNWKEMLLLTTLPAPAPVIIDGMPTSSCSRVLLFGGQKDSSQIRQTPADKANPANYLEGANLSAFAAPLAVAANFSGASAFNADAPQADLLRCLP